MVVNGNLVGSQHSGANRAEEFGRLIRAGNFNNAISGVLMCGKMCPRSAADGMMHQMVHEKTAAGQQDQKNGKNCSEQLHDPKK